MTQTSNRQRVQIQLKAAHGTDYPRAGCPGLDLEIRYTTSAALLAVHYLEEVWSDNPNLESTDVLNQQQVGQGWIKNKQHGRPQEAGFPLTS